MAFHSFQKIHYLSSTFYGQKQGIEDFSLEAEKVPGKSSVGDLGFKLSLPLLRECRQTNIISILDT